MLPAMNICRSFPLIHTKKSFKTYDKDMFLAMVVFNKTTKDAV